MKLNVELLYTIARELIMLRIFIGIYAALNHVIEGDIAYILCLFINNNSV